MEMASEARVWLVYLDESEEYDREMIEGWKDTIDVLFVFALQPDYAMITASLMTEMVGLQRAMLTGNSLEPPKSKFNIIDSTTTSSSDVLVNGLWFASLSFALGAALMSVLVKQWLQHYTSALTGTPRERVVIRHFRFIGLNTWKLPVIIGLLPVLLHIALLLFFAGLVVFLAPMNTAVALVVACIGGLSFIIYIAANILPLLYVDCPYKNQLSDYVYFIGHSTYRKIFWQISELLRIPYGTSNEEPPILSMKARESGYALAKTDALVLDALVWVDTAASNPTVGPVVLQAFAGLPARFDNSVMDIIRQFQGRIFESLNSSIHTLNATPADVLPKVETLSATSQLMRSVHRLAWEGDWFYSTKADTTVPTWKWD
ncbi:hypothetical protein C8J56DRAFT_828573, partial [Mycena floridula]